MTQITEWVEDIIRDVPDALESVVERNVALTMQDFFRRSESWRHTIRLDLEKGKTHYDLVDIPFDTYVYSIRYCKITRIDGTVSDCTTLDYKGIDFENVGASNAVAAKGRQIVFEPTIEGGEKAEIEVVLQVTRTISEIDDLVSDSWYDVIRNGAISRLLTTTNKDFTDLQVAEVYISAYNAGLVQAKRESRGDRNRPKRNVRFNPDFRW